MSEVLFYHLERASVEDVLPGLLEKTLARKWRACVQSVSRERVERLDAHLWTYRDESFLPHAAGARDDGPDQPIWITDNEEAPNDPQVLFLIDGARRDAAAVKDFERCVLIFDGRDDEAVTDARAFWKAANTAGLATTYWKQSAQGKWEKQT